MTLEDLDLNKFVLTEIPIKVTNKSKVNLTLAELADQYKQAITNPNSNARLPVLLEFDSTELELITQYISQIIFSNPLADARYLDIHIGNEIISLHGSKFNQPDNLPVESDDETQVKPNLKLETCEDEQDWESDASVEISKKNIMKKQSKSSKTLDSDDEDEHEQTEFEPNTKYYPLDDNVSKVIPLNESGSAYVLIDYLPEHLTTQATDTFHTMWNLHPENKHKIIMYEKEVEVSRYSKSYGKTWTDLSHTKTRSYMYSGFDTSENNGELPDVFTDYYNWVRTQDPRYNQVIANWYENKSDYIAPHSDCVRGMIPNPKISIISFYSNGKPYNYRFLEIKPKYEKNSSCPLARTFKIRLTHGSVVTMCGQTQNLFTHGIAQTENPVCERISLSFRQMV